jgi:hypothetical protein
MNALVIIGLAVAGYFVLAGAGAVRTAERLVVQFRRIRNARLSGTTLVAEVVLAVNNPTNNTLRINAITGRITYKGLVLGTVNRVSPLDITGLSEVEVAIPIRVDLFNALALTKDYVLNSLQSAKIELLFTLGVQQLPFSTEAPLANSLPTLPLAVRNILAPIVRKV